MFTEKFNKIAFSTNEDKSDNISIRLYTGKICRTNLRNILIYVDEVAGENTQEHNLHRS